MLSDSLRRRLDALNREHLPATAQSPLPKRRVLAKPQPSGAAARVEPLLGRGEIERNHCGEHLAIRVPVAEIWPAAERLLRSRHEQFIEQDNADSNTELDPFVLSFPGRFVGLDLETCGLGGAALFLVGLVHELDGELTIELLLARTYAEEAAVLTSLANRLVRFDTLLTFNGKSFDWPTVGDRWRRHLLDRQHPLPELVHLDVLHHARRRWRKQLPDCKLQTLERLICRRSRTGDIAGHLIPSAYDHFVQTGEPAEMESVLYHNAVDLVTLLDLAMRLAG